MFVLFQKDYVSKHDKSSLYDIADKNAGQDLFHVFESLVSLGKSCIAKTAENRPEMVVVYTTLHNVMSPNVCTQQTTGTFALQINAISDVCQLNIYIE